LIIHKQKRVLSLLAPALRSNLKNLIVCVFIFNLNFEFLKEKSYFCFFFVEKMIPYLKKIRKGKRINDKESEKKEDDYVLSKLFKSKKSIIHSAHNHDVIIENSDPDFALVEEEANKIATEAVRALKESRKYCQSAESGKPNLTSTKFGLKTSARFIESKIESEDKSQSDSESASDSEYKIEQVSSSKSLLERIKLRNASIHVEKQSNNKKKTFNDNNNPINSFTDLAIQMKDFIAHGTKYTNKATSDQLIKQFNHKLKKKDGVKFKAILKEMCTLKDGVWSLNDEFFNL
jgi:DNA excision repair protein ERCC-6